MQMQLEKRAPTLLLILVKGELLVVTTEFLLTAALGLGFWPGGAEGLSALLCHDPDLA